MARPLVLSVLSLVAMTQAAVSQPASETRVASDPASSTSAEIIVRGAREAENQRNREAVGRIGRPVPQGGFEAQYGRWEKAVCITVAGLPADSGQYIADRIGQVARDVGLRAEGAGCTPNIAIVVTNDPRAFLNLARNAHNGLLAGLESSAIEQMLRSDAPVRWAGLAEMMGSQGDPKLQGDHNLQPARAPTLRGLGSRLTASTKAELRRMVVIVDSAQVEGMKIGALSSYLAMVSLAQLRPRADAPMVNTILSSFRKGGDMLEDLSDFDRAYLKALYTIPAHYYGPMQKQAMVGRINRSTGAADSSGK